MCHDRFAVSCKLCACHSEEHIGAPAERSGASHCYKSIHVRSSMNKPSESADKEFLVYDHHDRSKYHLNKPHRYVIASKKRG